MSSKIAAGEVIERPASVVKELVENSLDAGATEVSIETRGGGVDYIRVTDNARGIPSPEVELAFQRFATSKLTEINDLEEISTLGFRGEALPSVAAAASVTLVTRVPDEDTGTLIEVAEGEIVRKHPHGAPRGTSVTVRQLFWNFPARRKFLRSAASENSRIQALVTRYALCYPEVRFVLSAERSAGFSSPGSGHLRDAVAAVYGLEVAGAMLELSTSPHTEDEPPLHIGGIISPPGMDRANRSYISFFVNGRWVQAPLLNHALTQSYHGFLMERRFPIGVVKLAVPLDEVDVNVHPAKTEVRFRKENQVFAALQQTVRHTLTGHAPVPEVRSTHVTRVGSSAEPGKAAFWPVAPFARPPAGRSTWVPDPHAHPAPDLDHPEPVPLRKTLPALRVLGQVQNTYIAAEGPDGMYLIDQHAAHERVVFEKVRSDALSRTAQVQSLLEPATVELSPEQQRLVQDQGEWVSAMGFDIEPFGDSTFLIRGVPALLTGTEPGQAFLDVLDAMAEGGGFESWEERAAYSVACHGAIRAGKVLSPQEMSELARRLEQCQQPNTCPHGRPTMIHLSSGHLEREFGRR